MPKSAIALFAFICALFYTSFASAKPTCKKVFYKCFSVEIDEFSMSYNTHFKHVSLVWTTTMEKNNDFFVVERSTDGFHFESIKTIDGAGNSEEKQEYITEDEHPIQGISYYRIKMLTKEGNHSYSETKSINIILNPEHNISFSIRPNPSKGKFNIKYEQNEVGEHKNLKITVQDGSKKVFYSEKIPVEPFKEQFIQIDLEKKLEPGIYFVTISSDKESNRQRILIE